MGRGSAVPGLRGPGLFPPWPRDDDDGSDCSNRDGFLETLRVGDLLVKKMKTKRRTRRSRRFFYSQKDLKGPFSSGLSFFFKSSRVGGLNLSLTRNNEVHCSQFFYFDCFYIVCLFVCLLFEPVFLFSFLNKSCYSHPLSYSCSKETLLRQPRFSIRLCSTCFAA